MRPPSTRRHAPETAGIWPFLIVPVAHDQALLPKGSSKTTNHEEAPPASGLPHSACCSDTAMVPKELHETTIYKEAHSSERSIAA